MTGVSGSTPLNEHRGRGCRRSPASRARRSSGTPSHSATLIKPKFAGLLLPEHSNRCAPIGRADFSSSSTVSDPSARSRPDVLMLPGPAVLRDGGRTLGADERLGIRGDQPVGFEARQIGDQPRIEATAAELHAVRLYGSAGCATAAGCRAACRRSPDRRRAAVRRERRDQCSRANRQSSIPPARSRHVERASSWSVPDQRLTHPSG